ncbi:recombinase family protein [Mycolicibacterium tokaiense]|uniref:Recombinase n=1 Tax=Mycolicibacterium tokaiense TaxID=39695 RepID=A0A378TB10_9MYCO|nr:recombinase family protein [Mycolicibacterium tokaiense]BBY87823.1 serine recombinase [Mycolicibacterium tokaiense]STZ57654.1 recombinase [Mycolicibacterium tokaiense]
MASDRCVLYARISYDRSGERVGVDRQLVELRKLAKQRDFEVVAEVTDNDISASKDLHRPGYESIWELVRAEQIDAVVVWQTSRLTRSRRERAAVISEFGRHRVDVVAVKGPSLELRTAYGRGVADLMTAFDTMESEVKSERVSAAIADLARKGRAWGLTPYGWDSAEAGVWTINRHEAGVVKEIVGRILAHQTLNSIQRRLNERGEPAPAFALWQKLPEDLREQRLAKLVAKGRGVPSRRWADSTIRAIALRDANAGVRARLDDATVTAGCWPVIIKRTQHERVRAMLSAPQRRAHTGPRPGARRHLLTSGIGLCGPCGGVLRVATRTGRRTEQRIYQCATKGCTGRRQDHVDALVERVVIGRLADPEVWARITAYSDDGDEASQALIERCEGLQRRLDDAADLYAQGGITAAQLQRITATIAPDLDIAQRERDAALRTTDVTELEDLAGPEVATRWGAMAVSQRRAVLDALGVTVTLLPRAKKGPGFEPETVKVTWILQPS